MSANEDLLEELIHKHQYIVAITLNPKNDYEVIVDFAGKKNCSYRVVVDEDDEIHGISYNSSLMQPEHEEFLPLPRHLVRLYILCDIYRQCRQMKLSYDIIRFYSPDGEKIEFVELLPIILNEDEEKMEQLLEGVMTQMLNNKSYVEKLSEEIEPQGLLLSLNILRGLL